MVFGWLVDTAEGNCSYFDEILMVLVHRLSVFSQAKMKIDCWPTL